MEFRHEMGKVEAIENEVSMLTPQELAAFRKWFREFDAEAWDQQIEADIRAGRLDELAEDALKKRSAGKCSDL